MEPTDFYSDRKYCPDCKEYVHYLMSVERSYCIECGSRVRLFSKGDWEEFNESLSRQRSRGGRRKRNTGTGTGTNDQRPTGTNDQRPTGTESA